MELHLERTEYNLNYMKNKIKAILAYQNGMAEIDLFLNGEMVYYYVIENLRELSMDDSELLQLVTTKLVEDKKRWIRDCTLIEDHWKLFRLIDKVSVYKACVDEYEFMLKLSMVDKNGEYFIFRLEYTNSMNDDVLDCIVKAKNYDELIQKVMLYAKTIFNISDIFIKNQEELMKNAFSKYFRQ